MKKHLHLLFLLCLSQISFAQNWYKGNLHTHSLWSDGDEYPEMIMAWYKASGYHFVGLSDHNTLQEGEKWRWIPRAPERRRAFERYLHTYGPEWVVYEKQGADSLRVRLKTLAQYAPLFQERERFLILQSEELSASFAGKPLHLNATNIRGFVPVQKGNSVVEVLQSNIDAVMAQRRISGQPMFPHINHPNFHFAISPQDMMQLKHERFFEVYNGHPEVFNYGDSSHLGMEALWDQINLHYVQNGQALLYGLATDDSHHYHFFGPKFANAGRGWVMVQSDSLHGGAIVEAMEAGRFYASTGVELSDLRQSEREIALRVKTEEGVKYKVQFVGAKKGQNQSGIFLETAIQVGDTNLISYSLKPDEWFVRAKIISDKSKFNPYFPEDLEMAWTQPVGPRFWPKIPSVSPLPNAHAHNDYEHNRPLIDALAQGFTSVEADVFLLKDSLYVNHNRPFMCDPARTLENLYLRPLREQIKRQVGQVYKGYNGPFYLFIDLKTEAESTYQALAKTLNRYRDILQICTAKKCKPGPVQVILSGNRPIDLLNQQVERLAAIDARPADLDKGFSAQFMPIVSDNYRNHFTWFGQGEMPSTEKEKLQSLVKKVHAEGKKLRLWASPENENVWRALREVGVDLINTDRLEELRAFLLK
jgi:glycerophosphoryl diester phosphodiesterase